MKKVMPAFCALSIPVFCYLIAYVFGWFGLFIGYSFDVLFFFMWPLLVLFFLIGSILTLKMWRTAALNVVLMILCVVGCYWGYESGPFLNGFETRLKHEYKNIPEIQDWALGILKTAERADYPIDKSAYPSWATISHFPKPHIVAINDENLGDNGYIEIGWGSGVMGTWGVAVGKPTLPKTGRKWADGVYFFANPEPRGWHD